MYRVIFKSFSEKKIEYTLQSHTIYNFVEAFNKSTGEANQIMEVKNWPTIQNKNFSNFFDSLRTKNSDIGLNGFLFGSAIIGINGLINKNLLGSYSEFSKLAKKTDNYHFEPINIKNPSFKYHVIPFSYKSLSSRHISKKIKYFIDTINQKNRFHIIL